MRNTPALTAKRCTSQPRWQMIVFWARLSSLDADTEGLTEAYGHFKTDANNISQDYEPKTVATDG